MKEQLIEKLNSFFIEIIDYSIDMEGTLVEDMVIGETMSLFIHARTECFNSTDLRVGGANTMKWFGNLITSQLYLLSHENKWLQYESISMKENGKGVAIQILQPKLEDVPEIQREMFVETKLRDLFTNFQPVFQSVSQISGLSIQQTWGLLTNSYYNHLIKWLETHKENEKIECDAKLLKSLDSAIFGLKRNPYDVSFRYVNSWWEPTEPVRVKTACCMSYLKSEGHYCYSCPKLSSEERVERGKQLNAESTL